MICLWQTQSHLAHQGPCGAVLLLCAFATPHGRGQPRAASLGSPPNCGGMVGIPLIVEMTPGTIDGLPSKGGHITRRCCLPSSKHRGSSGGNVRTQNFKIPPCRRRVVRLLLRCHCTKKSTDQPLKRFFIHADIEGATLFSRKRWEQMPISGLSLN